MAPLRPHCVFACVLAVLLLSACGGGGGDGTTSNEALLDDAYFLVAVGGLANSGSADQSQSLWGLTTLDGLGGLTGTFTANFDGAVSSATAFPPGTSYTVAPSRETSVLFGGLNGYAGWTDPGGELAITSNNTPGDQPAVLALARLGSGYSAAVLENFYRFCAWGVDTSGNAYSLVGSMTLNGNRGTGTAAVATNVEGTVLPGGGARGVTYTVAPNGQVTLDLDGIVMDGVVFRGGEAMLLAGSTAASGAPVLFAAVKTATGLSDASFTGTYTMVGIERSGAGFAGLLGTAEPNGLGSLTASFTRNDDGVLSGPELDGVEYAVTPDGGVTLDPTSGTGPIGGMTQDGNFVILGGPPVSSDVPVMYLLLRR